MSPLKFESSHPVMGTIIWEPSQQLRVELMDFLANPEGAEMLRLTIEDNLRRVMKAHAAFIALSSFAARAQCLEIIDRNLRQMLQECVSLNK